MKTFFLLELSQDMFINNQLDRGEIIKATGDSLESTYSLELTSLGFKMLSFKQLKNNWILATHSGKTQFSTPVIVYLLPLKSAIP